MNKEYILEKLKSGATLDEIAEDFSAALNEAQEALIAENDAKLKAEEEKASKRADMKDIIGAINHYVNQYIEEPEELLIEDITDEEIDSMCDEMASLIKMFKSIKDLKNYEFTIPFKSTEPLVKLFDNLFKI